MSTIHPRKGEHGESILIKNPSTPTSLHTWSDPLALACCVPDGPVPAVLNGVALAPWDAPVEGSAEWEALAQDMVFVEPPFNPPPGVGQSAGAVLLEPDGRAWLVAPTNGFGGYAVTAPKGRTDGKSLKATALIEVFEESGLRVRLTGHLVDVLRTTTFTRYYVGERIGGCPSAAGWETQSVLLVPREQLEKVLTHSKDQPIVKALLALGR